MYFFHWGYIFAITVSKQFFQLLSVSRARQKETVSAEKEDELLWGYAVTNHVSHEGLQPGGARRGAAGATEVPRCVHAAVFQGHGTFILPFRTNT